MLKQQDAYNEYMKGYMARRYDKRKAMAIEFLGGKCSECGSTEDLQFDHVDPSSKEFVICRKLASVSQERLEKELAKCQLLCKPHHYEKTREDGSWKNNDKQYECCGNIWIGRKSYSGHCPWHTIPGWPIGKAASR